MYCARSVRQPAVVTYCESYVHGARVRACVCVCVAVVEISSWRLIWRNPGTSSGVMWMDIGRRFDVSDLYVIIKVIIVVGRVYVTKCGQSSTFDHHDFASVTFCECVTSRLPQ